CNTPIAFGYTKSKPVFNDSRAFLRTFASMRGEHCMCGGHRLVRDEREDMMPRGANKRREREYGELVHEFQKEGRYRGRQKEVAARIVNKQRARSGETKPARAATRRAGGSRSAMTR